MADEEPIEVPRVIRQLITLRRKAGLSQRALAERMGTGQSAISELETGEVLPNLTTLARYAAEFGMEVVVTIGQEID